MTKELEDWLAGFLAKTENLAYCSEPVCLQPPDARALARKIVSAMPDDLRSGHLIEKDGDGWRDAVRDASTLLNIMARSTDDVEAIENWRTGHGINVLGEPVGAPPEYRAETGMPILYTELGDREIAALEAYPDNQGRLDAYYFSLPETGNPFIDGILKAVGTAGKGCHHTQDWTDYPSESFDYIDLIAARAKVAAAKFEIIRAGSERLREALNEVLPHVADEIDQRKHAGCDEYWGDLQASYDFTTAALRSASETEGEQS